MSLDQLWVFGYGSLVWHPNMPYTESHDCKITGWGRRFWQGSPDHRGTEENEGRVVTLLPMDEVQQVERDFQQHGHDDVKPANEHEPVWGKVFLVHPDHVREVMMQLDHREKAGYDKATVEVTCANNQTIQALVFHATLDNPHFIGPSEYNEMAEHILRSEGPSGLNIDYLKGLVHALEDMSARVGEDCVDTHLKKLMASIKELEGAKGTQDERAS